MKEVEEYLIEDSTDTTPLPEDREHEMKLESLAILASMGGIKEYTGVEMSVEEIKNGKHVAKWNKRAKEALEREMDREQDKKKEGLLPSYSSTNIIAAVVLGVTVVVLYLRYRLKPEVQQPPPPPNTPEITHIKTPNLGMQ